MARRPEPSSPDGQGEARLGERDVALQEPSSGVWLVAPLEARALLIAPLREPLNARSPTERSDDGGERCEDVVKPEIERPACVSAVAMDADRPWPSDGSAHHGCPATS